MLMVRIVVASGLVLMSVPMAAPDESATNQ
jgi:hypothetical protein